MASLKTRYERGGITHAWTRAIFGESMFCGCKLRQFFLAVATIEAAGSSVFDSLLW